MISNLRFAFRQLAKSPGFTVTAVLTLALGIGVCTAMFSVIRAVLLKPLPFREPDRLVWIENVFGGGLSGRTSRADTLLGWREQTKTLEAVGAYFAFSDYGSKIMRGAGEPERLRDVGVSDNFLDVLGVRPLLGRNFTAAECAFNGPGALILSHSYWRRRFGGDPGVIGTKVTLNNQPCTIVGVLPAAFDFDAIFTPGNEVDILTPFPLAPETARWGNTVFGLGRLKPGASVAQAQAELTVISERLREVIKDGGDFGARVEPLDHALRGKFRNAFLILTAAALCVLAIACVNLSNLLLARLNVRRQEFAVRVALGARRSHLVGQALTESLLLAFAGLVFGVPLAWQATDLLARLQTFGVPLLQTAQVDPAALLCTIGLTTLAGLACGLLPAISLSRRRNQAALQHAAQQRSAGRGAGLARNSLVVAEVALACILLVGAGLLFRSFSALLQVNLGFVPDQAIAWRIDPQRSFQNGAEVARYFGDLTRRVAALPGVETVGLSDTLPLGRNRTWGAGAVGVEYAEGTYPFAFPRIIDAHYLQAMRIPLIAGRYFDEGFNPKAEKTVIINQSLAQQLWPDRDPLGRKIAVNGGSTVIGVVADVRHSSLEKSGGNEMYLDCRQTGDWGSMEMVVRLASSPSGAAAGGRTPESLVPEVRAALASFDPGLPSGEYQPLEQLIDDAVGPRRLISRLLGIFSALALGLAVIGLYGVMAFAVTQRQQEIGIRMALGAQRRDILAMILNGGLRLVVLGVAAGLAGSFILTRLLQSQLFGVSAADPLTFVGIAALLAFVATLACFVPARRATKVDPMVALRAE
ncbi:MAG TPA: ABC transporter permease [Lacunisphaera sp.]|nr:ABC transporter permease [Lacunisphaera sp.]